MRFTFKKSEKLKSRKAIQALFSEGKYIKAFPLRMVYLFSETTNEDTFKVGFSVSKRNFKSAVHRNKVKRLLREAYRLNKHLITSENKKGYIAMFIYGEKGFQNYAEIEMKMIQLLTLFNKKLDSK